MEGRVRSLVIVLVAVVLIGGLQAPLLLRGQSRESHSVSLDYILPGELAGWRISDLPLGATESQSKSARDILQFDDHAYRSYSRPGLEFSVYVAYWKPGRPARALVGSHTPDLCWVSAGCTILERQSERAVSLGLLAGLPGEWRRFEMPDRSRVEVLFWHLSGGNVLHFNASSLTSWWRDALREIQASGEEQYFVRITSPQSLNDLLANPEVEPVLRSVFARILASP
jgi:hypothetical protein